MKEGCEGKLRSWQAGRIPRLHVNMLPAALGRDLSMLIESGEGTPVRMASGHDTLRTVA
jgi:hypothetical protein